MSEMVERVAKVLAECHGDAWDDMPEHKADWIEKRGQFNGRFRDVNERFRSEYLDEARAAIEAMRKPTVEMQRAGFLALDHHADCNCDQKDVWPAMIDAALLA